MTTLRSIVFPIAVLSWFTAWFQGPDRPDVKYETLGQALEDIDAFDRACRDKAIFLGSRPGSSSDRRERVSCARMAQTILINFGETLGRSGADGDFGKRSQNATSSVFSATYRTLERAGRLSDACNEETQRSIFTVQSRTVHTPTPAFSQCFAEIAREYALSLEQFLCQSARGLDRARCIDPAVTQLRTLIDNAEDAAKSNAHRNFGADGFDLSGAASVAAWREHVANHPDLTGGAGDRASPDGGQEFWRLSYNVLSDAAGLGSVFKAISAGDQDVCLALGERGVMPNGTMEERRYPRPETWADLFTKSPNRSSDLTPTCYVHAARAADPNAARALFTATKRVVEVPVQESTAPTDGAGVDNQAGNIVDPTTTDNPGNEDRSGGTGNAGDMGDGQTADQATKPGFFEAIDTILRRMTDWETLNAARYWIIAVLALLVLWLAWLALRDRSRGTANPKIPDENLQKNPADRREGRSGSSGVQLGQESPDNTRGDIDASLTEQNSENDRNTDDAPAQPGKHATDRELQVEITRLKRTISDLQLENKRLETRRTGQQPGTVGDYATPAASTGLSTADLKPLIHAAIALSQSHENGKRHQHRDASQAENQLKSILRSQRDKNDLSTLTSIFQLIEVSITHASEALKAAAEEEETLRKTIKDLDGELDSARSELDTSRNNLKTEKAKLRTAEVAKKKAEQAETKAKEDSEAAIEAENSANDAAFKAKQELDVANFKIRTLETTNQTLLTKIDNLEIQRDEAINQTKDLKDDLRVANDRVEKLQAETAQLKGQIERDLKQLPEALRDPNDPLGAILTQGHAMSQARAGLVGSLFRILYHAGGDMIDEQRLHVILTLLGQTLFALLDDLDKAPEEKVDLALEFGAVATAKVEGLGVSIVVPRIDEKFQGDRMDRPSGGRGVVEDVHNWAIRGPSGAFIRKAIVT